MDYQLGPGPLQVDQNTIDEKIKGDIGIVENGDVATHAIPSGYYVIWKGDLYVAKTDISIGTTLSAASNGNLTAKSNGLGGEVAALNSNMQQTVVFATMASGVSGTVKVHRMGKVRIVQGNANPGTGINLAVATLDVGDRPSVQVQASVSAYDVVANGEAVLGTDGILKVSISGTYNNTLKFNFAYTVD